MHGHVLCKSQNDTTQDAVRVIPAYRDDFYFVHITDTHLPTYLYYYQDGADTDSTTSEGLREITLDVNIINPAFVIPFMAIPMVLGLPRPVSKSYKTCLWT